MDDASAHNGHGDAHGDGRTPPSTDIGRALSDVLAAAPQFVATLRAEPRDHDHDGKRHGRHGPGCLCARDCLDQPLREQIDHIGEDLDKHRNPAGVIANCHAVLKQLVKAFGELNGEPETASRPREQDHGVVVGAMLLLIAVVAGAYLLFGAGTDTVYPVGDADVRQFAYPAAVEAPNLANWLAWAILILALAGAAMWTMARTTASGAPRRRNSGDHADLRALYERGFISRDLYVRGRRLAPQDPLVAQPQPTEAYAAEYGAYIAALADALCHRRALDTAGRWRQDAKEPAVFGARPV